jgi:hypothetical protein
MPKIDTIITPEDMHRHFVEKSNEERVKERLRQEAIDNQSVRVSIGLVNPFGMSRLFPSEEYLGDPKDWPKEQVQEKEPEEPKGEAPKPRTRDIILY